MTSTTTKTTIKIESMIQYLQYRFDKALYEMKHYGDHHAERLMDDVIAQKELVEALIGMPVNLRLDNGRVTIGYDA